MRKIVDIEYDKIINHSSRIPYYFQIKNYILKEIDIGNWVPGMQIPTENELCENLNISRTVIRQALQELVTDGYLFRSKGKGTFVKKPQVMEKLVHSLVGFYEDMTSRGYKVESKVLLKKIVKIPEEVQKKFDAKIEIDVIRLKRLRSLNGKPFSLDDTYIPYSLCPNLVDEDLEMSSLYNLLENKYGLDIYKGYKTIKIKLATAKIAQLLNIEKDSPLFAIESISYLKDGRPIEYYKTYHSGQKSCFMVELKREKFFSKKKQDGQIKAGLLINKEKFQ